MKLPPLRAVQYFEAVSRLESFSAAANELCVSQSAVSHQIKILEDYLGESLIVRGGRNLHLTKVGKEYYDRVSDSIYNISLASESVKIGIHNKLRLTLYSSLAVKWLVPRLTNFQNEHPEIDLELNMVTEEPKFTDSVSDCFITTQPPTNGFVCEVLYKETLYPYCSRKIWGEIREQNLPDELFSYPLLSVKSVFNNLETTDWDAWKSKIKNSINENEKKQYFSHMVLAVEAARHHQGIVLSNEYFLNDQDKNDLVCIPTHGLPTGDTFYLVYKKSRVKQREIIHFRRWIKKQCY
ncbi:LysR family transcriptional regulator [Vibrio alginolyticus]|uniref:LysR family transcriptional regulator n=1 Tax=Vibrio alginolyticus TaxID=663 RepID=UPI002FF0758B